MQKTINLLKKLLARLPREVRYSVSLFILTRFFLSIIGLVSRLLLEPLHGAPRPWVGSAHRWLDLWGQWDSGWYLRLAREWYGAPADLCVQTVFGFFPFYPLLIRGLGFFVRDYYLSGLLISNSACLVAGVLLFRLARLDHDDETSLRSTKYLFLFPCGFLLSGVLSESLSLALTLAVFYAARKERWWLMGGIGFFAALTRPLGIFLIVPLLAEYFQAKKWSFRRVGFEISSFLLFPAGLLLFCFYTYRLTGDWAAYWSNQVQAWQLFSAPPVWRSPGLFLQQRPVELYWAVMLAFGLIGFFLAGLRRLRFSYALWGVVGIVPLFLFNANIFLSGCRYLVGVFPLYFIAAAWADNRRVDDVLTAGMCLVQGFLMVFWSNGFKLVV